VAIDDNQEVDDLLTRIVTQNFSIFEKLKFKKRSIVFNVVKKLMRRAQMGPLVANAIAEMIYEDLELEMTSDELVIKCQLIKHLYEVVEAVCKRFGECHIELKQDEYTVLRIIQTSSSNQENSRETPVSPIREHMKSRNMEKQKIGETTVTRRLTKESRTRSGLSNENSLSFSEVVNFVNTDESIKDSAISCHFLSAEHNLTSGRSKNDKKPNIKVFRYSEKL